MSANPRHTTKTSDWYTPPEIVAIARDFLGEIDLDPASSPKANEVVGAAEIYVSDGLAKPWAGKVYLNPPSPPRAWWERLVRAYAAGDVERAVFLAYSLEQIPQSIGWGLPMTTFPILFRPGGRSRIPFLKPNGSRGLAPPHGSALVFLGTGPLPPGVVRAV